MKNEPKTEDMIEDTNLCDITAPTEEIEGAYRQHQRGKYIKLGLGLFMATPFLCVIYVLLTR